MTKPTYVAEVQAALMPLADQAQAAKMAAYMKNHFAFLGIASPLRRASVKAIAKPDAQHVHAIARALWKLNEREYVYVAIELLQRMVKKLEPASTLQLVEELALQKSWWDSVDGLAHVASDTFALHAAERGLIAQWSKHPNFWINRLALLHQNSWKEKTDEALLFKLCLDHAHNPEFFIRKAIGWALRDYAWTRPEAVQKFVAQNESKLSPLSKREALKNLK